MSAIHLVVLLLWCVTALCWQGSYRPRRYRRDPGKFLVCRRQRAQHGVTGGLVLIRLADIWYAIVYSLGRTPIDKHTGDGGRSLLYSGFVIFVCIRGDCRQVSYIIRSSVDFVLSGSWMSPETRDRACVLPEWYGLVGFAAPLKWPCHDLRYVDNSPLLG